MDRSIRYQMLQQEEDPIPAPGPIPPQGIPPPAYETEESEGATSCEPSTSGISASASETINFNEETGLPQDPRLCKGSFPAPPPYSVAAAELPTYEEAQRVKILEEEAAHRQRQEVSGLYPCDDDILGTDLLFFTSFFVAFLFNWVGFLLLLCFCHTLAGRYGALAGFGLSLAKWTLIVKHSTDLVASENEWLWWIIMAFGVLICARACLQYVNAKREWKLLNPIQHDRLFVLY